MRRKNYSNESKTKSNSQYDAKRSNKRRGGRPQSKKEQGNGEGAVVPTTKGDTYENDPNWYFTDSEVARQAGELSFQQFLGVPGTIGKYDMPTIMTIHLNPSPGNTYPGATWSEGQRSGFNMSMTKLYNRLSMKSGRNMAYAPQDVGMAVLGIGELLSMTSYVRRLFGVVKWWNLRNRMVPKQIIKAMGIDPDDFFKYFSDYRMRANTLIMACNQIPILTNCGYLRKCASLYDNIYVDCNANLAQYYIYVPYSTWILDEKSDQRGTVAKTKLLLENTPGQKAITPITFDAFLTTVFEPMISALLTSSTLNLVYADILNLNKTEDLQLASLDIISEEYAVVPVHDPLVLKQIHNMNAVNKPNYGVETTTNTAYNDVVCDPDNNCIKYSPVFIHGVRSYGTSDPTNELGDLRIIDTDTSDPDLAEKIEVTRYLCSHTNSNPELGGHVYTLYAPVPDHYVVVFTIYSTEIDDAHAECMQSDTEGSVDMSLRGKAWLSQFDWAPIMYHYDTSGSVSAVDRITADLNSFTIVPFRYLQRLNTIIYMDLFEFR